MSRWTRLGCVTACTSMCRRHSGSTSRTYFSPSSAGSDLRSMRNAAPQNFAAAARSGTLQSMMNPASRLVCMSSLRRSSCGHCATRTAAAMVAPRPVGDYCAGLCFGQERFEAAQPVGHVVRILEAVVLARIGDEFVRLAGLLQRVAIGRGLPVQHRLVGVAVRQQHRPRQPAGLLERRDRVEVEALLASHGGLPVAPIRAAELVATGSATAARRRSRQQNSRRSDSAPDRG